MKGVAGIIGKAAMLAGVMLVVVAGISGDDAPISFVVKSAVSGTLYIAAGAFILHIWGGEEIFYD